jgi:3-isopropylmalate dehydrogenase
MKKSTFNVAVLAGDGIGSEVTSQAVRVLKTTEEQFECEFRCMNYLVGGVALEQTGVPLPAETLDGCLRSDAVLLGAVGSPQYDSNPPALKPETALLKLRKHLGAFANLRPAKLHASLISASPLKREVVEGTDVLIVRELTGGLYFGEPRGFSEYDSSAFNTLRYSRNEVVRVARIAFEAARKRRKKLHSIDKANVLETSQLWRSVVAEVAVDFRDVTLKHLYVDNCAMQLVSNPTQFDVILTENLFGDILSDEAAMLTGSIGMLASASIGERIAIYEPVHGSAPDIAGKGIANPLAAIASVALMLRYSFGLNEAADALETAIANTLESGYRTADIYRGDGQLVTTETMTNEVLASLESCPEYFRTLANRY